LTLHRQDAEPSLPVAEQAAGQPGAADATGDAQLAVERRRQRAVELAFRFVGRRERTAEEVHRHLVGHELPEDVAAGAVAELSRDGYVDDARYARLFAEDRRTLDGWGAERIERRLLELGVAREHVAAALAADAHDELEAAVAILRRRFPAVPETDRDRGRALGVLVRKGYDLELAHDALRAHAREALEGPRSDAA
jgi:regulatory protein